MAGLSITLQGFDQLERAFSQAPQVVGEELGIFMHGLVAHLEAEVKDRTPAAHGLLRASIVGRANSVGGAMNTHVLGIVGSANAYVVPVELGTKPHMPPVLAIEDWVKVKLGLTGKEARSAAWGIARKIAKKGTKGAFMFRDAFEENAAEVQHQFDQTISRILARI